MLIKLAVHPRHRVAGWVRDSVMYSFSFVFHLEPHGSHSSLVSLQLSWGRAPVPSGTVTEGKGMGVSFTGSALLLYYGEPC